MKILLTGGAGLIGRHAVDHLVREGHEVISLVREARPVPDGLAAPTREVIGDVGDRALVDGLVAGGVEAVVHLAAIPAPVGHTAVELLAANALTTMTVLESAGTHGVRHIVLASSMSVLGMAWSDELMHPVYLPVDEEHPLRPTEGYALSKEDDEAAARMAARRWGVDVVALRFPFTGTDEMIRTRALRAAHDEEEAVRAAKELWAYLDVRDATRAIALSLEASAAGVLGGSVVLNLTADDVLVDAQLPELIEKWHPDVPVVAPLGNSAYNISRARELIGFVPQHPLERGRQPDDAHAERN